MADNVTANRVLRRSVPITAPYGAVYRNGRYPGRRVRYGVLGRLKSGFPDQFGNDYRLNQQNFTGPRRYTRNSFDDRRPPRLQSDRLGLDPALLDKTSFVEGDGGLFVEIGNPANRGLKREHVRQNGDWPRDPVTGRDYDVAHYRAIADGGKNVLENIRPMHPDAHRAEHLANGDSARWGARASIARAFGGRVQRGLGVLSIIPTLTGILSGRISIDSVEDFANSMMGQPTRREIEQEQKRHNPKWKRGDPIVLFT